MAMHISALANINAAATIASDISNQLLTTDKQTDTIKLAFSLHALSNDYGGIARELVGTIERQRRAVAVWAQQSSTESGGADTAPEELCSIWESLVTVALELASRHGHLVGLLALDSEVYSRLSAQIVTSQRYEQSSVGPSRSMLIRTATDACYLTSELARPLVQLLVAVKAQRESTAASAGPRSSDSSISPAASVTGAVQRVLDMCPESWRMLEQHLDGSTGALIQYASLLSSLHASMTQQQPFNKANIAGLEAEIETISFAGALIPASTSILRKAPPMLYNLLDRDPELRPNLQALLRRYSAFNATLDRINKAAGRLEEFSRAHEYYGFHACEHGGGGVVFREWCPEVLALSLVGDFNDWDPDRSPCNQIKPGVWELELAAGVLADGGLVKVAIKTTKGESIVRISPFAERAVMPEGKCELVGVFVSPTRLQYAWKNARPGKPRSPRIYEAHIGIASDKPAVASYTHFTQNVLPRIAAQRYNCVQLMAVMEHAYYGCFGYQVTNFFAVSSRYGTIDELKELIDTAHGLGLTVLLDLVHSHASKNVNDGLNRFNGTDGCYFHEGPRGSHAQWDSKLFNYGKLDVLRFLLSNIRMYLDVFKFDGFRFDGVTSMLYKHHGIGATFSWYGDYFNEHLDVEACVYLMLANKLIKSILPSALSIAEDVSGQPTICRPIDECGFGFDFRLAMGVPDYWIKLVKDTKDEEWNMGDIAHVLTNRRFAEPVIAYAESHDQALVGDKTLAFWMMDSEMYTNMSCTSELTAVVDRGISMHKIIRLITHSLAGEGYLNFIGNEFGHPEWLDFPRVENEQSYHYARRQWPLVDDKMLRYRFLNEFDRAMHAAEDRFPWLDAPQAFVSLKHNTDKVIVFERGSCIFAFNFNVTQSFTDYRIGAPQSGKYCVLLSTDFAEFGGHDRVSKDSEHFTSTSQWHNRPFSLQLYLPSRSATVLYPVQ